MKADYVHKDTLTATDYVELNKNNELLISYNQALLKENRELKKQVETYEIEGYEQNEELNKMSFDIRKYKVQQKEFTKYLEDKIYSIEPKGISISYNCEYDSEEDYVMAMQEQSRLNTLKEILQKYKSIIGSNNE